MKGRGCLRPVQLEGEGDAEPVALVPCEVERLHEAESVQEEAAEPVLV